LKALKGEYGDRRKIVVFQPHLYSRTKALFDDFVKSFSDADLIYLLPIYYAREDPDPNVSSDKLVENIKKEPNCAGKQVKAFKDFDEAYQFFANFPFKKGDIFVTMGAGEAFKIADKTFNLK